MFQSQYIEKLLNVFKCFFLFSPIFFFNFGQKGKLNFYFRTNFTLLIKNGKTNMGLNICLLWTIICCLKMLTIFEKIEKLKSTLKHRKHWIEFNVHILKNIDIALSFNVHFFDIKNIESKSMSTSVQTLSTQFIMEGISLNLWQNSMFRALKPNQQAELRFTKLVIHRVVFMLISTPKKDY
jgi:hypothetical protein